MSETRGPVRTILNTEDIEAFVGGDAGACPERHPGCLIFATGDGPLHVRLGDQVNRTDGGYFWTDDHPGVVS